MGKLKGEMIPFKNFKEKIRLVKEYSKKGKVSIVDRYIYVTYKDAR